MSYEMMPAEQYAFAKPADFSSAIQFYEVVEEVGWTGSTVTTKPNSELSMHLINAMSGVHQQNAMGMLRVSACNLLSVLRTLLDLGCVLIAVAYETVAVTATEETRRHQMEMARDERVAAINAGRNVNMTHTVANSPALITGLVALTLIIWRLRGFWSSFIITIICLTVLAKTTPLVTPTPAAAAGQRDEYVVE